MFKKFALVLTTLELIGGAVATTLLYGAYNYNKGYNDGVKRQTHTSD